MTNQEQLTGLQRHAKNLRGEIEEIQCILADRLKCLSHAEKQIALLIELIGPVIKKNVKKNKMEAA